eukprot:2326934-Prymnesium_polylepis.1
MKSESSSNEHTSSSGSRSSPSIVSQLVVAVCLGVVGRCTVGVDLRVVDAVPRALAAQVLGGPVGGE